MSTTRRRPTVMFIVSVALVAVTWSLWYVGGYTLADSVDSYLLGNSLQALTFTAFGAVVLTHRPRHRIGTLFVAYGLCYLASVAVLGVLSGAFTPSPGWERAADVFGITVWAPAPMICLPLILQLFPDGAPLSRRWRWLVPVTFVVAIACVAALTLRPDGLANEPIVDNSPLLPDAASRVVGLLLPYVVLAEAAVALLSVTVLGLRAWRSRGETRLRVMWLLYAAAVFLVLNAQRVVTADGPILFVLTLALIPAAGTIAIVRHQLYDIRLIVNRSLVYAVLTAGVIGAYLGIVAGLQALAGDRLPGPPLLATGAIALVFAPARVRVQSIVDRLMYGERRDPEVAAARVGVRLTKGLDSVLRALGEALRIPYAAVSTDGRLVATYGELPEIRHTVALEVDGPPADLLIGLRAGETVLSAADRRALDLLAAPIGLALQSVRLSEQLRDSRTRIVAAREEERRRLRRDLHDGLGTALTAVTLKADAAYNLRESDPARSGQLLLNLRADVTDAIADIRRLVYDLRPPDLDELGLIGALRQRAEQSWRRDGDPLVVTIDAPADLPALPAAVEVAVYRIASEAVTNTLRHGQASSCEILLRVDDAVHLEIRDNGADQNTPWRHGVGLRSMHERAGELGGTVTAGPTDHGGRVHALLPLEPA